MLSLIFENFSHRRNKKIMFKNLVMFLYSRFPSKIVLIGENYLILKYRMFYVNCSPLKITKEYVMNSLMLSELQV